MHIPCNVDEDKMMIDQEENRGFRKLSATSQTEAAPGVFGGPQLLQVKPPKSQTLSGVPTPQVASASARSSVQAGYK